MNAVNRNDDGWLACGCGAMCTTKKDEKRFLRRHPVNCNQRRAVSKQLAEGVRSVEDSVTDYDLLFLRELALRY